MKRFVQVFLVIFAGVLSVLLAGRGIRKLYRMWNKRRYTDLMWDKKAPPWG